jgi:hypothetical protein
MRAIAASLLAVLLLCACRASSSTAYRQARVGTVGEGRDQPYSVCAGDQWVLVHSHRDAMPWVPDAHSAYRIYLPVAESSVVPGTTLRFSAESTPAYLWQENGPSRNTTTKIDAELVIVERRRDFVRAVLRAKTRPGDVQTRWTWAYDGEDYYVIKPSL